jgi:glycosyltransferase involved in cell wall biosynthesis
MTASSVQVAHVTTAHPKTDNRIFRKECVALEEAGIDVRLIAVAAEDDELDGIGITALPARRGRLARMLAGSMDAWRALRHVSPAMIHVHDPELIPLAILWRLKTGRPAVYDAHEDLPRQVRSKRYLRRVSKPIAAALALLLEQAADRFLSSIVAATPSISMKYKRNVTLVQNFPWLNSFPRETQMPDQKNVVYVGSITRDRGIQEMLSVADALPESSHLMLAGPMSSDAANMVKDVSSSRISYSGVVEPSQVPNLIAAATVGLAILHPVPNYLESQSTKIYEYMAASRPFVASHFPSWVRQLGPYNCGIFVDPRDIDEIISAVRTLFSDPLVAEAMGRNGRNALEQHFAFDNEAPGLITMTRGLLEGATTRGVRSGRSLR